MVIALSKWVVRLVIYEFSIVGLFIFLHPLMSLKDYEVVLVEGAWRYHVFVEIVRCIHSDFMMYVH